MHFSSASNEQDVGEQYMVVWFLVYVLFFQVAPFGISTWWAELVNIPHNLPGIESFTVQV